MIALSRLKSGVVAAVILLIASMVVPGAFVVLPQVRMKRLDSTTYIIVAPDHMQRSPAGPSHAEHGDGDISHDLTA